MHSLLVEPAPGAVPIWFVTPETWPSIRDALPAEAAAFAEALGFSPAAGRHVCLPDAQGALAIVLFAMDSAQTPGRDPLAPGALATVLPPGVYRFANDPPGGADEVETCVLAWLLSAYVYARYKGQPKEAARLTAPAGVDVARASNVAEAIAFGRDLVNAPANDLGPVALEEAAVGLAQRFRARATVTRGERLLGANLPLIHAVGRASEQEPRLVDFVWGPLDAPKITLVGKGVCFDTGGLDLKPSSAMALMKKDMAGAATALALAQMIMAAKTPVRLRVLLPIVENSVASGSFRPGDVYPSRKALTVEIGNTDAEGRLILADALALAEEDEPALLFDFATLTGAARVALGPDLPPFYTHDETLGAEIAACGAAVADPVWRMPLWQAYDSLLDSPIATLNNVSSTPFAGSIVAALFLARFVAPTRSWAHFDVYGWNPSTKPGRPAGGEIQTARLLFALIERRFKRDDRD